MLNGVLPINSSNMLKDSNHQQSKQNKSNKCTQTGEEEEEKGENKEDYKVVGGGTGLPFDPAEVFFTYMLSKGSNIMAMAGDNGLANNMVARCLLNDIFLPGDEGKYKKAAMAQLRSQLEHLLYEVISQHSTLIIFS